MRRFQQKLFNVPIYKYKLKVITGTHIIQNTMIV